MPRRRKAKLTHAQKIASFICIGILVLAGALIACHQSGSFLPVDHSIPSGNVTDESFSIHVIDVGNADSILVKSGEVSLLIDAGENNDGDTVLAYLRSQNVKKLDYAIATHPDADHIGGMDTVILGMPVDRFIMSYMPDNLTPTTKTYMDLLDALDKKNISVTEAKPGTDYALNEATLSILGPMEEMETTNNMSVVCKVSYGKRRFLFMGDAEKEEEDTLLKAKVDLTADFIKLGHHGSHSSSQEKFIAAVNPHYAVMTCGKNNKYGHPHKETLSLISQRKIQSYRTDIHGNITIVSDGDAIQIKTQK